MLQSIRQNSLFEYMVDHSRSMGLYNPSRRHSALGNRRLQQDQISLEEKEWLPKNPPVACCNSNQ
jgi:hypothetical protein